MSAGGSRGELAARGGRRRAGPSRRDRRRRCWRRSRGSVWAAAIAGGWRCGGRGPRCRSPSTSVSMSPRQRGPVARGRVRRSGGRAPWPARRPPRRCSMPAPAHPPAHVEAQQRREARLAAAQVRAAVARDHGQLDHVEAASPRRPSGRSRQACFSMRVSPAPTPVAERSTGRRPPRPLPAPASARSPAAGPRCVAAQRHRQRRAQRQNGPFALKSSAWHVTLHRE